MTADHEQHVGHGPDQRPQIQQLPLADKLVTSFQARQDLVSAQNIYSGIDSDRKAWKGLEIGDAQIALGIDPSSIIEEMKSTADSYRNREGINKVNLQRRVARLQARQGNFIAAKESIDEVLYTDSGFVSPLAYTDIASMAVDMGNESEAQMFIAAAINATDNVKKQSTSQAYQYAEIARIQKRTGADPKETLDKAVKTFEEKVAHQNFSGDRKLGYVNLIKGYADCGYFEEALQLVPKIKVEGKEEATLKAREKAIREISLRQAHAGLFDDAMQTVGTTNDLYAFALVASDVSLAAAKDSDSDKRSETEVRIERAKQLIVFYEQNLKSGRIIQEYEAVRVPSMLATVGEAEAAIGIDPQATFQMALEEATEIPNPDDRTYVLIDLALSQQRMGIDAKSTFDLAFVTADNIVSYYVSASPNELDGMSAAFNAEEQLMAYKDIADAALDAGQEDFVEVAIQRIDKYEQEWGDTSRHDDDKVELYSKRSQLRAAKGLSREEIDSLTPADIHAILTSGNPLAEEATEYFGLSKGQN